MYMTNIGKQMMLDLKIQTAQIPACKFIIRGKVGGRFNFVDRPFFFNFISLAVWFGKGVAINYMSQLKHYSQCQTGNEIYQGKSDDDLKKRMKKQRNYDHISEVESLAKYK